MSWKTRANRTVTREEEIKVQVCDQCDKEIPPRERGDLWPEFRLTVDTYPGYADAADYVSDLDFCSWKCIAEYAAAQVKDK